MKILSSARVNSFSFLFFLSNEFHFRFIWWVAELLSWIMDCGQCVVTHCSGCFVWLAREWRSVGVCELWVSMFDYAT